MEIGAIELINEHPAYHGWLGLARFARLLDTRVKARALRALANIGLNAQGFRICRFTAWASRASHALGERASRAV